MRKSVVFGDADEIEIVCACVIENSFERPTAVAVKTVGVQIAAKPSKTTEFRRFEARFRRKIKGFGKFFIVEFVCFRVNFVNFDFKPLLPRLPARLCKFRESRAIFRREFLPPNNRSTRIFHR